MSGFTKVNDSNLDISPFNESHSNEIAF